MLILYCCVPDHSEFSLKQYTFAISSGMVSWVLYQGVSQGWVLFGGRSFLKTYSACCQNSLPGGCRRSSDWWVFRCQAWRATLGVERVLPGCGHTTWCTHRREYILPVRNNLLIPSHPREENFWRGLASNLEDRDSGGYLIVPHFEAIRRKGIYCECLCIRFCGHVFLFLQYKHSRIGMLENVVKK